MQQQPAETVQLFFNGHDKVIDSNHKSVDNVYKDYIIQQNKNLMKENKKLVEERIETEKKYEEMEEEAYTTEKRFKNTKDYLKNFRFINENLESIQIESCKIMKGINFPHLMNELRLLIGIFSLFLCLCSIFGLNQWWVVIPIHGGYLYLMNEISIKNLKELDKRKTNYLNYKKEKDLEIKKMKKTMDIISEFIDNAL